ncbi:MAG: hypothetical protein H7Y11_00630, partial [Armatimonadetes bacterium]|nr:hypothetical protein [Anaerolineae bacterium]
SEDRLAYTFQLREGVLFHDGTLFNALAVGANLDRITNPNTKSTKALTLLGTYSSYLVNSEYNITLTLAEPYSPLLDGLSQVYLGIASPTALAQYSPERYQFHQVGTGPYTLVEFIPDTKLVLRRNPAYQWGPSFYQSADATMIDEIEYRFFTDRATRFDGLESGSAQIMGELPAVTARSLTGSSQFQLIPAAIAGQPLQFLINTRKAPTDSLAFRQAMLYATNRAAIADAVYQGFSPVAWGPLTSNTQFYSAEMNGLYAYDFEAAAQLLAGLGYTDADENGYLDAADGGDLEVKMIMPPWSDIPQVAQLMQDQWRTLKLKLTLVPVPDFPTLISTVNSGDYHLVAFNTYGVDPAFLNAFFVTGGSRNWTGFSDPALDRILTDAVRLIEPGTRTALYAEAQRIIMDNALILPIRETVNLNASANTIQGLTYDSYGWFPLMLNVRLIDN